MKGQWQEGSSEGRRQCIEGLGSEGVVTEGTRDVHTLAVGVGQVPVGGEREAREAGHTGQVEPVLAER